MADFTATQNGDFNDADTWDVGPGHTPASSDNIAIGADYTVTIRGTDESIAGTHTNGIEGYLIFGDEGSLTATADLDGDGQIQMLSGTDLTFNSATDRSIGCNLLVRGNSYAPATIQNTGGGRWQMVGYYLSLDAEWLDATNIYRIGDYKWELLRLIDSSLRAQIGSGSEQCRLYSAHDVEIRRVWLSGFTSYALLAQTQGSAILEDITLGERRTGESEANGEDIRVSGSTAYICNLRATSSTLLYTVLRADRLIVDNYGCANGEGNPGCGYVETYYGTLERSTSAKKTGDYGCRVTPKSTVDADAAYTYAGHEIHVDVPIQSGDDVSVSVYGRRHGMTDDCAEIEIDPTDAWGLNSTAATTLTDADTWYEFSDSASGASGSGQSGTVRIVLRMMEYAASAYFDWADAVIVVGRKRYRVDFDSWSHGKPIVSDPHVFTPGAA